MARWSRRFLKTGVLSATSCCLAEAIFPPPLVSCLCTSLANLSLWQWLRGGGGGRSSSSYRTTTSNVSRSEFQQLMSAVTGMQDQLPSMRREMAEERERRLTSVYASGEEDGKATSGNSILTSKCGRRWSEPLVISVGAHLT